MNQREENQFPSWARQDQDDTGYELGLETALIFLSQLDRLLVSGKQLEPFFQSIRLLTKTEALLVLEALDNGEAKVFFSHLPVADAVVRKLCRPEQLYSRLARIRFAHFFQTGSPELPSGLQNVNNMLAVPIFSKGAPTGCLAAINKSSPALFGQRDALLLSVAASVFSLGRIREVGA